MSVCLTGRAGQGGQAKRPGKFYDMVFRTWFSGLGISTLGRGFSHSRFPRSKPENF